MKPGWVITVLLILGFTYLAFDVLAPWQLHKNTVVTQRNHLVEDALKSDPRPIGDVFAADGHVPSDHEYQRVEITGHYLPQSEVVMRVRPVDNGPAYHALTPFMLDDGRTVLINRGWQRPEDGKIPASFTPAPTGTVTIVGHARISEAAPATGPVTDQGRLQVHGINTAEIGAATNTPLLADYVQLTGDQPGVLTPFPLPVLDSGPHLSYGIQWIAFGIMAPLGLAYFVWAEMRERRREAAELAELSTAPTTAGPDPETPQLSQAAKARARYGNKANERSRWARTDEEQF